MVIFKKSVYQQFENNVNEHCEVGGILMGVRLLCFWYLREFTASFSKENCEFEFILNEKDHSQRIKQLQQKYAGRIYPIGIWHSHIDGVPTFSSQDKRSNEKMAEANGKVLSVLAVKEKNQVKLYPYAIYQRGRRFVQKKQHIICLH